MNALNSAQILLAQQAFGLAVRMLRQKKSLSQDELAQASGLHRSYISSVERGARNLSFKNIIVLAGALQVTPSELLSTTEQIRQAEK